MRLLTPYLPKALEALPVKRVSRGLDRIRVHFDDTNLVANAGLLLVGTLVVRLGLEQLTDSTVRLAGRVGGFRPGRKVLIVSLDQNPESTRTTISPVAPARRTRAMSSWMKRRAPRAVFADPLRMRACSTSPVSARLAKIGW